jgi:RNA polymerase sigma factor (sigma-70 family)
MQTEVIGTHSDGQIVEAVRGGNVERYRELVERYERLVYAVAWSKLGDPNLAEEATQEAFIRGYRNLGWLNRSEKFGAWISSIARRVAINIGFRNRRELNKRKRWALEQNPATTESGGDAPEICTPEILRQALAELPDTHRECLVLFYLEGKSGAEAAIRLGLSDSAFRVRLHRARSVLREQLDQKLERSLEKLRPAKSVVPAVMAAVLVSSSAKAATGGTVAATVGAKVLSALGKSFLFSWFVPLLSLIGVLPGLGLVAWYGRVDRSNYREPDGFRARRHRRFYRSFFWGFPLLMLSVLALQGAATAVWGTREMLIGTSFLLLWPVFLEIRRLTIYRNPYQVGMCGYTVVILAGLAAQALNWLPQALTQLPLLIATTLFALVLKHRPVRMDYSLLLRAARGLLKPDSSGEAPQLRGFDREELLACARFLGSRWLAVDYRWETRGLALRLAPVKTIFLSNMLQLFKPMGRRCSFVLLGWDGTVSAHCNETDATDLVEMEGCRDVDLGELEAVVESAVSDACQRIRNGDRGSAERILGEVPENEVFVKAPARSASTRFMRVWVWGTVGLMALLLVLNWQHDKLKPVNGARLKAVSVSEAEIRASLAQLENVAYRRTELAVNARYVAQMHDVLPPTNLFTGAVWQSLRDRIVQFPPDVPVPDAAFERLERLLGSPERETLLLNDWLPVEEFAPDPEATRRAIAQADPVSRKVFFELTEGAVGSREGTNQNYTALSTRDFARKVRVLQKLGCLDAVNGAATVETLLRHQVLSKQLPPGRRQDLDPKLLHGTFLCFGQDPIEETWEALVILEAFGALDRIDRAACVDGILRFHHGKGIFGSVREHDGFVIFGNTRDTLCAFESLRMLNALDRVKDLEQWKFRPMSTSNPATTSTARVVTWEEIEAWVCQQRFERMLRERKENPGAPVRSLLQP